ncbi:transposase [Bacillus pacificus]|uniref:RNA-guided endonuclease TnpB family protein n=1 Tax=Bacillus pacificus TaxID=2026187 RepID=UPI001E516B7D|nr:RNA-guided endonuclease TnpB family protein [Bacillus pacificus]MCC2417230.1 transposase [Bacillus pacificus]
MARKKAVKVLRKQKKRENMQRFTQKQNIGRACLTTKEFRLLQRMSHSSKALRNVGLYTMKQSYLNHNRMATVKEVDTAMQNDMNYSGIQSNSVQAIRRSLFTEVKSFFKVLEQMKKPSTTTSNALSCDLGVDRLLSCVTNTGDTFLIDGKKLKSINQYFNKMICNLQQKNMDNGISKRIVTNKMAALWHKRERQINGYIAQTVGLLFKKVKEFNIDTIIVGYNAGWKQKSHMGKKNNQKFVQIPFQKLIAAIENKCVKEGIRFLKQEESYTSKASFLDKDPVPVWSKDDKTQYRFSGKRITRGLYQSKAGTCIHADINGALNTLKKSGVVELDDNLKVKTPILLEVQKRKAIALCIA